MNVREAVLTRHSYRGEYQGSTVPREDLMKILEAGLAAPSGCNKQTTSLIAVDDPAVMEKVQEIVGERKIKRSPAAVCVLTQRVIAYEDRCFAVQDYSAAIENMLLAIVDLGYESCWYEGYLTGHDRMGERLAKLLGVPEEYELICYLPVGKAAEEVTVREKKPFGERAWFNRFGGEE